MNKGLSIRHWPFGQIRSAIREARALLPTSVGTTNKQGYTYLSYGKNKALFKILESLGFFDFHRTNTTRRGAYLHQVVLYLHKGWKLFRNGKWCDSGVKEVHHLDHDVSNNDKTNLRYVSPQENKFLAILTGHKNFSQPTKLTFSKDFVVTLNDTLWRTFLRISQGNFALAKALVSLSLSPSYA